MGTENAVSVRSLSFRLAAAQFRDECRELDAADAAHLDRWVNDPRAEAVWRKVKSLAWAPIRSYDPLDGFILTVLIARRMAESIPVSLRIRDRQRRRSAHYVRLADQSSWPG